MSGRIRTTRCCSLTLLADGGGGEVRTAPGAGSLQQDKSQFQLKDFRSCDPSAFRGFDADLGNKES